MAYKRGGSRCAPEGGAIDTGGDGDRVHAGQTALGILHIGLEADLAESRPQQLVHVLVTLPERLKTLLARDGQGLPEAVEVADGSGVVVRTATKPTPVVPDELEVSVVRGHLRLAALQLLHSTLVHHEGAGSGRGGERLLPAGVNHVHVPLVRLKGDTTQGADSVHNQEAVVRLCDFTHTLNLLHGPRGGLALAQEQRLGLVLFHRCLDLFQGVGLTGGLLHGHHLQAVALR
eukprot:1194454-Prorocentrum_minimum.AAC.3